MLKKLCIAGQATDENTAHALCMPNNYGYTHKHTPRICNTYCFSTATMVARPRLNVTDPCTLPGLFVNNLYLQRDDCICPNVCYEFCRFLWLSSESICNMATAKTVTRKCQGSVYIDRLYQFRTNTGLTGKASVAKHNRPQHTSKRSSVQALLNSLWN
jgi:hypothetical protein